MKLSLSSLNFDKNDMKRKMKCGKCKEIKTLKNFSKRKASKNGFQRWCKICRRNERRRYRNTEHGFMKELFQAINKRVRNVRGDPNGKQDPRRRCYFTWEEFWAAWEKHKENWGMRSAWGPHHLEMTMISKVNGVLGGGSGGQKGRKLIPSNVSGDRLDNQKPYTIQNLIFIRNDENARKKDTTYDDCQAQIKLYTERFINMESI